MSETSPYSSGDHTGHPEIRADERLYLDASDAPFQSQAALLETWQDLVEDAENRPEVLSRVVLRGVVNDEVLEAIRQGPHGEMLEVAVPLDEELGRRDANLIYLGHNAPGRQPLMPVEEIIASSAEGGEMRKTPEQRIQDLLQNGNSIRKTLSPDDYEGLHELWGPRFGWVRKEGEDQIADFGEWLAGDQEKAKDNPNLRTVWFAGVHDAQDQLVAAAMGFRLTVQGNDGPIDLVESTEWSAREDAGRNGYGRAAVAALNAQILSDLAGSPNGRPLIFAECNFMNRADLTGTSVGMAIPPREHATQVLRQNVAVGDGQEPPGLRDFNFLILPRSAEQQYYTPEQNERMLGMINS